ncbi:COMM domain-containing 10-like [Brachionus plicatilis]|uniref:COMM domain-containing 10-like n=1 Tax=Brachionus plicatilis TaxID=10195 RepID=A0A3M7REX0_BRAPC|nr:COMM domain-containing 10-like [Brachionus plicatilis]
MSSEFIVETEQIKKAVQLINEIGTEKFPLLLQRIALKIHSATEVSFKQEEIEKLEKSLELSNENVLLVIEILEFIFLQSTYEVIKAQNLAVNLAKISLNEDKVTAIAEAWKEHGKEIIEKIRQNKAVFSRRLLNVKWRLNIQMANSMQTKQKTPNALFEFNISGSSAQPEDDTVQVEFNKEQLYDFFLKLETIQKQIDTLSKII